MTCYEEIALLEHTAKEVGVLYEHPIDKDCYVFRSKGGLVMKAPKAFINHPKLKEAIYEHSNRT